MVKHVTIYDFDKATAPAPDTYLEDSLSAKALELLPQIRANGPRVLRDLNRRISLADADTCCEILRRDALSRGETNFTVHAYDFPGTQDVWSSCGKDTPSYRTIAIRQLVLSVAAEQGKDPFSVADFKELLPLFTGRTFAKQPINRWGTTLGGLLVTCYANSPSAAILDLVYTDPDFLQIAHARLAPYDFVQSPVSTWVDKEGKLTKSTLDCTKALITTIATKLRCDYRTVDGFKLVLQNLTSENVEETPINTWGTTLSGMRQSLSDASLDTSFATAVCAVVASDPEFEAIRTYEPLREYDLPKAPNNMWRDKSKRPTAFARELTRRALERLAAFRGIDYRDAQGFKTLLPHIKQETFQVPINKWGTKADSMLTVAYGNSPSHAVLDLVQHDPALDAIKRRRLHPHDFSDAPKYYWTDKEGNPTLAAQKVILALLKKVAEKLRVPPDLENHGAKLTDAMTWSVFRIPLNFWGLTAAKPLKAAYNNDISAALEDLRNAKSKSSVK